MTLIPIDITPKEFQGILDVELVPMDIEETMSEKRGQDVQRVMAHKMKDWVRNVVQVRAKQNKDAISAEVVHKIMREDIMIRLQELTILALNL